VLRRPFVRLRGSARGWLSCSGRRY
jgi:hypothetical protein